MKRVLVSDKVFERYGAHCTECGQPFLKLLKLRKYCGTKCRNRYNVRAFRLREASPSLTRPTMSDDPVELDYSFLDDDTTITVPSGTGIEGPITVIGGPLPVESRPGSSLTRVREPDLDSPRTTLDEPTPAVEAPLDAAWAAAEAALPDGWKLLVGRETVTPYSYWATGSGPFDEETRTYPIVSTSADGRLHASPTDALRALAAALAEAR